MIRRNSVTSVSNENISDQIVISNLRTFEKELYQYFISVDLILGSGETYLIDGAIEKGRLLSKTIQKFTSYSTIFDNPQLLIQSKNDVKQVNNLLAQSRNILGDDRQSTLNNLLLQSDKTTQRLATNVTDLLNHAQVMTDQRFKLLLDKRESARHARIIGAGIFGMFLFILWIWAYKRVCDPLGKLKHAAESSLGNITSFEGINKGPKEIVDLSKSLSILTNTLSHQASHDALTDLYNRRELERNLNSYTAQSDSTGNDCNNMLCYLDLDQFKIVNDTCGHIAGDELLKNIAAIIKNGVRRSDFVSRIGGDEFCFILYDCDMDTALKISNKIRDDIENLRYMWEDKAFRISACIGLAEIDAQNCTAGEILNIADTACAVAKELGRNRVHAFNKSDTELARKRTEMSCINQIHLALEENRFVLYRQNIVPLNPQTHRTPHFEVLIRMVSNEGQLMSPYGFLPTAERYHLATKLDQWVISHTFELLMSHPEQLEHLGVCNINLSGQSFSNLNMADFIIDKLIEVNMPANKICFEITESAAVTDITNAKNFINKLKDHGCLFALDDFGSGLSSFQYLKNLPVDIIKIDGAFVKNMDADSIDRATVKSIHEIASASGKQTVAEFVENEEILKILKGIGVDYGQGYYFDEPTTIVINWDNIQDTAIG